MSTHHEKAKIRKKSVTPKDFALASLGVTEKQHALLSKLDPDKPLKREDRREDEKVDWREEEAKGNCVRVRYEGDRMAGDHAGMVGGQPQTHEDLLERRRSHATMRHIYETGRRPNNAGPQDHTGPDAGKLTGCRFGGGRNPSPPAPRFAQ